MVSIKDVADAANVSSSTVSYVLSGKRPISKATADRVHQAIHDLHYRPNAGARALASARTSVNTRSRELAVSSPAAGRKPIRGIATLRSPRHARA